MAGVEKAHEDVEFDWIKLRSDMDAVAHIETTKEKMIRKFKENPLVPIGCFATATALSLGLWSLKEGKKKMSQQMMRLRIGAQGFTVVALIVGVMASTSKSLAK